jgi:hypothetical protein
MLTFPSYLQSTFDNKDSQTHPLEVAATDTMVIQSARNFDREAKKHVRYFRSTYWIFGLSEGIAKDIVRLVVQSFSGKVSKPHLFISKGSGVVVKNVAWVNFTTQHLRGVKLALEN